MNRRTRYTLLFKQKKSDEQIAAIMGRGVEGFCRNVIHRVFRTYNVPSRAAMNAYEPDSYIVREKETE